MLRWLYMLVGPLLWALHFGVVYGIASISLQTEGMVTETSRILIAATSVAIVLSIVGIAFWPRRDRATFRDTVRVSGALVSIVGVTWQTLPIILR